MSNQARNSRESFPCCNTGYDFKSVAFPYRDVAQTRFTCKQEEEGYKSERWMPRLPTAKKDAVSCENPGLVANRL